MIEQVVVTYCICDDVTQKLGIRDDLQCVMSTAEVMTFAIMSASIFYCDYKRCHLISKHFRFFRKILSYSRMLKRIKKIPENVWLCVFKVLSIVLRNRDKLSGIFFDPFEHPTVG